jgi:hypothetical protein
MCCLVPEDPGQLGWWQQRAQAAGDDHLLGGAGNADGDHVVDGKDNKVESGEGGVLADARFEPQAPAAASRASGPHEEKNRKNDGQNRRTPAARTSRWRKRPGQAFTNGLQSLDIKRTQHCGRSEKKGAEFQAGGTGHQSDHA